MYRYWPCSQQYHTQSNKVDGVLQQKKSTIKSTVTIVTKLLKYSTHANDQNLQCLDGNCLISFELILKVFFYFSEREYNLIA